MREDAPCNRNDLTPRRRAPEWAKTPIEVDGPPGSQAAGPQFAAK